MYKQDLTLNSQQKLICHKTLHNQTINIYVYIYMYKEDLELNDL